MPMPTTGLFTRVKALFTIVKADGSRKCGWIAHKQMLADDDARNLKCVGGTTTPAPTTTTAAPTTTTPAATTTSTELSGVPAELLACLSDESGCSSVQRSSAASGTLETPHPYANDGLYMFEVALPDNNSAKEFTWSFGDFEVDVHQNGTCLDEVWIFNQIGASGPYCGFDESFQVGLVDGLYDGTEQADSSHYDYYYEELLNSHNLASLDQMKQSHPIRIGLKSGSHVHNYGFSFSWTFGCTSGFTENPDGTCSLDPDRFPVASEGGI